MAILSIPQQLEEILRRESTREIPYHEHSASVYTRCLDCNMWGVDMPLPFIKASECGNCKSIRTVKYYPSCCILADREFNSKIIRAVGPLVEALDVVKMRCEHDSLTIEELRHYSAQMYRISEKALAAFEKAMKE